MLLSTTPLIGVLGGPHSNWVHCQCGKCADSQLYPKELCQRTVLDGIDEYVYFAHAEPVDTLSLVKVVERSEGFDAWICEGWATPDWTIPEPPEPFQMDDKYAFINQRPSWVYASTLKPTERGTWEDYAQHKDRGRFISYDDPEILKYRPSPDFSKQLNEVAETISRMVREYETKLYRQIFGDEFWVDGDGYLNDPR